MNNSQLSLTFHESIARATSSPVSLGNELRGTDFPLVSIIVPLHNGGMYIRELLTSIHDSDYKNLEVIVVDDASTDNGLEIVRSEFPRTKIICNETNRGKSWSLNRGIAASKGVFLVMTDQDLVLHKELITKWVRTLIKNPRVGICGCYVYYNGSRNFLFTGGAKFDRRRGFPHLRLTNVELRYADERYEESPYWVFDNLYVVRRSVFDTVGVFDYLNFPMVYEEADLQLRASNAGYAKSIVPGARAFHTIPVGKLAQLRRFTVYKAEMLCRNRLILIRKLGLANLPLMLVLPMRSFLFYSFVATIQRVPLRDRVTFFKAVVKGVSRGLLDPVVESQNLSNSGTATLLQGSERPYVVISTDDVAKRNWDS